MDAILRADLAAGLPGDALLDDPDVVASYGRDMAAFAPSGIPGVVVLPRTRDEVQHVVRVAARHRVPIVPRGAGSGLAGSSNAIDGAITLSLVRMNKVIEIDRANRLAVVEPGVINLDFRTAVEAVDLFYPPDPSSYDWCTIGGNLSTNSGGLCCVKYGVTTDFVLAIEVVLADGEILRTGHRTVKGAAGRAVQQVVTAGLVPSLLEIMDQTCIRAVEDWKRMELDVNAEAMLLAQSDAGGAQAAAEMAALVKICADAGADDVYGTEDLEEGRMLSSARRFALPALERLGAILIDDVAVPRSAIAEFMAGTSRIAAEIGCTIGMVGHAGDGNMHPTVVFDPTDDAAKADAIRAFDRILELVLSLGGTITGEHGIGSLKVDWLEREVGPVSLRMHRAIKSALDPLGIFNPGKIFSLSEPVTDLLEPTSRSYA